MICKMITIDLKLFVTLNKFAPDNAGQYEIAENTSVGDLIKALKIPEDQVKLVFVNGIRQEKTYQPVSGDRVGLFPPVGGG